MKFLNKKLFTIEYYYTKILMFFHRFQTNQQIIQIQEVNKKKNKQEVNKDLVQKLTKNKI